MAGYLLRRLLQEQGYREGFRERLGWLPATFQQSAAWSLWIHAVSVGEVVAAAPLLENLSLELAGVPVYLSVSTVAGRRVAKEKLGGSVAGVFYAPLDYCFAVRRVLRMIRPRVVVILETEIWPNLYRETVRSGAGLMVVNGRISDRAFRSYRRMRWFFQPVLELVDRVFAESERSMQRYLALGVAPAKVEAAGNLKYSVDPTKRPVAPELAQFFGGAGAGFVWVAASTMPGVDDADVDEELAVIEAFPEAIRRIPKLLLVLVPRKPERFDLAAERLTAAGIRFVRRSSLNAESKLELPGVLLVDTMGELAGIFKFADAVFMGGTLNRRGGHNILEPAYWGKPVLLGPHMENFPEIAADFRGGGAVWEVAEPAGLGSALAELAADSALRERLGKAAQAIATSKGGVARHCAQAIAASYGRQVPVMPPTAGVSGLLKLGALLWTAGAAVDQRMRRSQRKRLDRPVVSVGGISMGGAGKTPLVIWLWQELRRRGVRAAVLTRGYGRRARQDRVIEGEIPGLTAREIGDEPLLMVASGVTPVGVSANRYRCGSRMEATAQVDLFLLDDGFQHQQLARQLEIVVLDALDLSGGGAVFPLGKLRQPLRELARADVIVVNRADSGYVRQGAAEWIRRIHPRAEMHFAKLQLLRWRRYPSGETGQISGERVGFFCGIGNPSGFEALIRQQGLLPAGKWIFRDHHRYDATALQEMAQAAKQQQIGTLLTTAKDIMNMPAGAEQIFGLLTVLWAETSLVIAQPEQLLARVETAIEDFSRTRAALRDARSR